VSRRDGCIKMFEYLICALRNLGRKRFRSFITVCGIMIGVASVIVIGTIGSGAKLAVNKQLDSLGINGVNISQRKENVSDFSAIMTDDDLQTCLSVIGVKSAMPLIMQTGNVVLHGLQKNAIIWGVDNNARSMISLNVSYGRMFSKSQVDSHAKVCLIDDSIAKAIYKRSNVTGKTISVYMGRDYETFKICGIVESGSSLLYNLVGDYIPTFVYLPYTTAEDLSNRQGFDEIMIKGDTNIDEDKIGNTVTNMLSKKNDGKSYAASNMLKQKERLSSLLQIVTLVITAVGAISLIVAGLGIMTVMLVSVNERTKEIGVKKAIGAKKSLIMLEFLFEALSISIIGGVLGIGIGTGLSYIVSKIMNLAFTIDPTSVLMSSGFALATGILFGVYPAYKAANLKPVDALRQE
jgi:putative ABC transport system permease protein